MDSKILTIAKKDLPLYFQDFKTFWDSTTENYNDKDLIDCYACSLIFVNWKLSLNHLKIHRLDNILSELNEDINASFFHAHFGHYRSAHMHLRSVIELALQLIYFYQHEVEYSLWKNSDFRIKHEDLTNYLKKHPILNQEKTRLLIDEITLQWKLFSKHIHAEAPIFFQTNLESKITKSITKKDFGIWKSNYLKTGYLINKLMLLFFKSNLNSFPTINRNLLLRNMKVNDLTLLGFN